MGGGGGGDSTQRVIKEIPKWAKPYYESVGRRGMRESQRGYQDYGGQRISPFSGAERQAFRGTQGIYSAGPRQELGYSMGQTQQAGRVGATPGQWGQQAYDQYANPYITNVLDVQKDRLSKDYDLAMARSRRDIPSSFAQAGTRGGRASVMGAREAGNISDAYFQNVREMESQGLAAAYDSAQQAFDRDRAARQAGADIQLRAADSSRALGQLQQDQAFQRIGALQQSGLAQREMQQSIRDMAYKDFLQKQNWNKENLNWFTGLLSGTPFNTANQTQMTTAPGASPISQGVGLGLAGLGAYQAFS